MKEFNIQELRNIGIIAHGGAGKTSLAEAMLYNAGAITRLGKVNDGTATMDYDPDEIKRQISLSSSFSFCEWSKHKLNLIDTPGFANFLPDTHACLKAADAALILVSAISGVKVETERVWKFADEYELPRLVFINKMDRERANFIRALGDIEKTFGIRPTPVQIPIGTEQNFQGVIDLLQMKAHIFLADGSGKFETKPIPAELEEEARRFNEKMLEDIVETDDELMAAYLDGEEISPDRLKETFRHGVLTRQLIPVLCGSGLANKGIPMLLDAVVDYFPSPADRPPFSGTSPDDGENITRQASYDEPLSAQVIKIIVDQHLGKLSIFRVISGKLSSDSIAYNSTRKSKERIGHIFFLQGKGQKAAAAAKAGEIAAVAKLKETHTGDTLCDESHKIEFAPITFPKPVISYAISPKSRGDEEKVSLSLQRLQEEDPSLSVRWNTETQESLVSGMGQVHLEVVIERLKRKFGVEVTMNIPKVPYKETVKTAAKSQGKYKRQSGGRGQFGDTWLEIEPLPHGEGFEFINKIVGGVIPKQYIPAVEKGVHEAMADGVLSGCYPMTDVRVTLYDGSYHVVDSSEMAFKIAGSMGFKKAAVEAKPALLEPIMDMDVIVPDECLGDVIGDLNSRRGKILGVEPRANSQTVKVQAPMSEVLQYATDLRSLTGGRGVFTMEFSHYEEVPSHLSEKIIQETKEDREEKR